MIPFKTDLKSSYKSLKDIFETDITAIHINEELQSCKFDSDSIEVKRIMESKDYEVFGVKEGNKIIGYVDINDLNGGKCSKYTREFHSSELISESTPLIHILPILKEKSRIFVLYGNQVNGIITRSDLQKLTVRLFLFGIISILEIRMTKIIKSFYLEDKWEDLLSKKRLKKAFALYSNQKVRNDNIELIDCLQLSDKKELFLKSPQIMEKLDYSKKSLDKILNRAERLRNDLAHSRDFNNPKENEYVTWSNIINLTEEIEKLLWNLEMFEVNK